MYFFMMAWLWAYYCFDYKWSLDGMRLADRLNLFETHWAFFSGEWHAAAACNPCRTQTEPLTETTYRYR